MSTISQDSGPQGWVLKDKTLTKTFKFANFPASMGFMVEVALFCEKTDHHPEWTNVYDSVHVTLSTHDVGDVTDKDHVLAAHMDAIYKKVL